MRRGREEFVHDAPGEEPGRGLSPHLFDQLVTAFVLSGFGVDGVREDIGIDDEH